MASILLTVAGSVAGNAILPGIGGALLGSAGAALGRSIDNAIFGQSTVKGPRLDQLKVQDSSYGNGIPVMYGTARVAGNVIWASDLIESISSESVGGKGFGGTQVEKASYAVDVALALGFGPIGDIRTIWADGKEVYSGGKWKEGTLWDAEIYLGTDAQDQSPLLESALGSGNVPANRGLAYVVLHRLQLGNFGNRLPNFTFEVAQPEAAASPEWLGEADPNLVARPDYALNPQGLPVIPVAKRGDKVTRVLVGALTESGGEYCFTAVEYDVSGDAPVELARTSSSFTALGSPLLLDTTVCASPAGDRVAFAMQFDGAAPIFWALYDIQARRFGDVTEDNLGTYTGLTQIAWLDNQRILITNKVGSARGVRVYGAVGLTVSPIGFFDVWGGDSASRFPFLFSTFATIPGGIFFLSGDTITSPTTLYGRGLAWQGNTLVVGPQLLLTTGMDTSTSAYYRLLPLSGGEWVACRPRSGSVYMMSFIPSFDSVEITRNWASVSISPSGYPSVNVARDRIYFLHQGLSGGKFRYGEIDLTPTGFTLGLAATLVNGTYSNPLAAFYCAWAVDATRFVLINSLNGNDMTKVALFEKGRSAAELSVVTADLLARAGYEEDDFDVEALEDLELEGYVIPDPMAMRAALQPLQNAFSFDLVESDGILKARLYGADADAVIDTAETRAGREKDDPPPRKVSLRAQELDLPREVVITHIDPALDYQKGSQRARRQTGAAHNTTDVTLPLVCSAEKAKEVAEAQLYRAWSEREQASLALSRAYVALDPGDVVELEGKRLRLTDLRVGGGLVKIEALSVDAAALELTALTGDSGQGGTPRNGSFVTTTLFLMDLPLLRNEDDQPGYYVAVSGGGGWRGAALFRSLDGTSFSLASSFSLPAIAGLAGTVLSEAPTAYMDRREAGVKVALLRGELSSCSEIDLLNGANAALLGDEIIQFQNATLNDDGSYTLTNILRGRRGTESAVATHAAGERFVLLQAETTRFLPLTLSDRGRATDYRAPSTGQDVSEVISAAFAPELKTLAPFSPVHVSGVRDSSDNLTVNWVRRARKYGEWVDLIDVPLDENSELYDVDILDSGTVVRSYSSVSSPAVTYTAAQQVTDFGSAQAAVDVAVYQLSTRYGRGNGAKASV